MERKRKPRSIVPTERPADILVKTAHLVAQTIERNCPKLVARVQDGDAVDLAFLAPENSRTVVRCVGFVRPKDVKCLQDMLRLGDFERAVLIYCDPEQPNLSDEIESWAISDVDALAASLAREGAPS